MKSILIYHTRSLHSSPILYPPSEERAVKQIRRYEESLPGLKSGGMRNQHLRTSSALDTFLKSLYRFVMATAAFYFVITSRVNDMISIQMK